MKKSFLFLASLFFINIAIFVFGWDKYWDGLYSFFHVLGGMGVAFFALDYFKNTQFQSRLAKFITIIGSVALVGVAWEVFEFSLKELLAEPLYSWTQIRFYFMGDLTDTIFDLILDIFGGAIAYFLSRK